MSDTSILELVTKITNELAAEIGKMEPDDPRRASFLEELLALTHFTGFLRLRGSQSIGQRMDELAREMATLKPGNPRRAKIVDEIMRLREMLEEK